MILQWPKKLFRVLHSKALPNCKPLLNNYQCSTISHNPNVMHTSLCSSPSLKRVFKLQMKSKYRPYCFKIIHWLSRFMNLQNCEWKPIKIGSSISDASLHSHFYTINKYSIKGQPQMSPSWKSSAPSTEYYSRVKYYIEPPSCLLADIFFRSESHFINNDLEYAHGKGLIFILNDQSFGKFFLQRKFIFTVFLLIQETTLHIPTKCIWISHVSPVILFSIIL